MLLRLVFNTAALRGRTYMTRRGKIARLPQAIREELNQRLENGEQGGRLLEWLNALPEVKQMLEQDFEAQPISDTNLSAWRNGGFRDWQARIKAESMVERWPLQSPMSENAAVAEQVAAALTEQLMVHYAAALEDALAESDEKPSQRVERLGRSLREMVRVQRARERADTEREWLALERERLELQRTRLNNQPPGTNEGSEALSHEEKAEMVRQMVEEAKDRVRANEMKSAGPNPTSERNPS
jgi:hypothetical protein